jgi:N-acetylglucosamine kinase-like BadF-type ATPase
MDIVGFDTGGTKTTIVRADEGVKIFFSRFLRPAMMEVMRRETLPRALAACEVLAAGLGENIGDYAAICAALNGAEIAAGQNSR